MIEMITNVNNAVNGVVWGWPALTLLTSDAVDLSTGMLTAAGMGYFRYL